jgi:hypothetical protein
MNMKKITVFDKDNGELIESVEFQGGYNLTYANLQDGGKLKHIRRLDNGKFDEKHVLKTLSITL